MTTCRDVLIDAFGALGAIAFGGQPTADEIDGGLRALENLISSLHGARGPLRDVEVAADYIASENQRVRVQAEATVVVTLPNSIIPLEQPLSDYGFMNSAQYASSGSVAAADSCRSRPPRDGARIEIVGDNQALYFYRADTNTWILANELAIDGPTPLNARYDGALASLVAERLCDAMNIAPSPVLAKRIARANAAVLLEPGSPPTHTRPTYL